MNQKLQRELKDKRPSTAVKRRLSIVDKEGVEIAPVRKEMPTGAMVSEYRSNFNKGNSIYFKARPTTAVTLHSAKSSDLNSFSGKDSNMTSATAVFSNLKTDDFKSLIEGRYQQTFIDEKKE